MDDIGIQTRGTIWKEIHTQTDGGVRTQFSLQEGKTVHAVEQLVGEGSCSQRTPSVLPFHVAPAEAELQNS